MESSTLQQLLSIKCDRSVYFHNSNPLRVKPLPSPRKLNSNYHSPRCLSTIRLLVQQMAQQRGMPTASYLIPGRPCVISHINVHSSKANHIHSHRATNCKHQSSSTKCNKCSSPMSTAHGNTYSIDRYTYDSTDATVEYRFHSTEESTQAHTDRMSKHLDSFDATFYTRK